MTFLGRIRASFRSTPVDPEPNAPVRNRTFSAAQFREQEAARAAQSHALAEALRVESEAIVIPNLQPIAEPQVGVEAVAAPVPPPPSPSPIGDPMPWDEAVGWLSQQSSETRNFVGTYWNWDHDLRVLHFLAQQPDLDAGVAAHIFWITAASEDYFPFGDDDPDSPIARDIFWLTDFLGRRMAENAFASNRYGFDDSWDCERLRQRLVELYEEGLIDWDPQSLPTASTNELMSFNDIPEDEREAVADFLARFGVH